MDILLLSGSPHEHGNTETLACQFEKELNLQGAHTTLWSLSKHPVAACSNCKNCLATGTCATQDLWHTLSKHMDNCDALVLITPLYFAGPPAHLKAALDRCQSYWARKYHLQKAMPKNRPAHLIILGDGGDPHGSSALETICTSALNCASLRVENRIYRFLNGEHLDTNADINNGEHPSANANTNKGEHHISKEEISKLAALVLIEAQKSKIQ